MTKNVKRNLFRVTEVAEHEYNVLCAYCRTRAPFRIEAEGEEALRKALLAHQRKEHKTRAKYELKLTEFVPVVEEPIVVEEAPAEEPLPAPPEVKLNNTDDVLAHLENIKKKQTLFSVVVNDSYATQEEIAEKKSRFFTLLKETIASNKAIQAKLDAFVELDTEEAKAEKKALEEQYASDVEAMYSVISHPWYAQFEQWQKEQAELAERQAMAEKLDNERKQAQAEFQKERNSDNQRALLEKLLKGQTWITAPEGLIGESIAKVFKRNDAEPFVFALWSKLVSYVQKQAALQGERIEKWEIELYQLIDALPVIGAELLDRYIIFEYESPVIEKKHKLSNGETITLTAHVFCMEEALDALAPIITEIFYTFKSKKKVSQVDACKPYSALYLKGKQPTISPIFIRNKPKRNKETGEITNFTEKDGAMWAAFDKAGFLQEPVEK